MNCDQNAPLVSSLVIEYIAVFSDSDKYPGCWFNYDPEIVIKMIHMGHLVDRIHSCLYKQQYLYKHINIIFFIFIFYI